jgi:hypothetical protein
MILQHTTTIAGKKSFITVFCAPEKDFIRCHLNNEKKVILIIAFNGG